MELGAFLEKINTVYSYDFRHYSVNSIRRRINHCMTLMDCKTIPELQEKVLQSHGAFLELMQYITVPVSSMFRDPSYFLSLREKVFPYLSTYPSVKIWVAGCSTGEEVYSLAIMLQEEGLLERTFLYATDINVKNLEKAKKGIFKLEDIEKVTPNYLQAGGKRMLSDYYTLVDGNVQFDVALKKNIIFSEHNLASDAVFSEMQLISCRHVLIYFNEVLQERVLSLFLESLCRKGFLGLGSKESLQLSSHSNAFDPFVKMDRIFQKR